MQPYGIDEIKKLLPHREPFLLIDEVLDVKQGESVVVKSKIREDAFWTPGHFPELPIMPGVLIIEAMAQACGVLAHSSISEEDLQPLYFLTGIDNVRFKKMVVPGEDLILKATVLKARTQIAKFQCEGMVDEQLVCSAELLITAKKED